MSFSAKRQRAGFNWFSFSIIIILQLAMLGMMSLIYFAMQSINVASMLQIKNKKHVLFNASTYLCQRKEEYLSKSQTTAWPRLSCPKFKLACCVKLVMLLGVGARKFMSLYNCKSNIHLASTFTHKECWKINNSVDLFDFILFQKNIS